LVYAWFSWGPPVAPIVRLCGPSRDRPGHPRAVPGATRYLAESGTAGNQTATRRDRMVGRAFARHVRLSGPGD
ncbi:MAG TPA: hypothetical protein VIS06_18680, partial [Mycobacteriales bacterium]